MLRGAHSQSREVKLVVGLKSVEQLTLGADFSVLRTITEVYNLPEVDNR